ncbi:MAG: methionyl-tRNA formyltransferase, partial [Candidatus Aminicenantes bacterium]|nr:methionyl-tRNA formyltransferase [Candidatus Aminicenantes bacterium]
ATFAPKLRKEDGRVDWSKSAEAVDRHVRAMTPWPSAFTFLGKERIIIVRGGPAGPGDPAGPRGTVLSVDRDGLAISCGGGSAYRIARIKIEGRREAEAAAFARSGKISPGNLLA